MAEIAANLRSVCDKILCAATKRSLEHRYYEPRLTAVSKLQSVELILCAYEAGQRHFGENYVNELVEKALNPQILEKCKEIQWHFIGNLQRNKVNKILNIPNLYIIETISNDKLANVLNNSWPRFRKSDDSKLNVMVQVNTSEEEGMFGYNIANGPNPDFVGLIKCREKMSDELKIDIKNIELSMGMSNDYEHAIELGSTNVRVGTAIFGNRPQKNIL
ncbi:pyridoxal phosphate homeostasis protein isoform X2 [Nylanderia fulva]|uniref:pyridoxal phosphate homeostasis protein isoform X2 n=1 Tax=Nylanderia fulva TaxID=613905 RepID=UPI0010FB2DAE|nr:pyridoxal phosphate homeostasis protein isoform X2 [Nylanderia fulva]